MPAFLYRCPNTGYRVQGWFADDGREPSDETFDSITCHACGQIHLVNPKTGKIAGAADREESTA